ncbi:hypothetical protein CK203_031959 [Vitis vinifera]|uniref:Retrotransposon Copia-like N-terminal domain-containing protein n=1 Tax=Vitis vinifera TaxID=29760 RepID=A0A438IN53_VITVI|nr:hypothetical protein CK203_031959 [Vitis vinifera]
MIFFPFPWLSNPPPLFSFQYPHPHGYIKLSSSNYLLWKSQLLPLLESQELIGYMDGTIEIPPRFTSEILKNQTSNMWYGNIPINASLAFCYPPLPRKSWLKLWNSPLHVRSVSEYARAFKALCNQLHAMGRPVDGTDEVHWFLRDLVQKQRALRSSKNPWSLLHHLLRRSPPPIAIQQGRTNAALLPVINRLTLVATDVEGTLLWKRLPRCQICRVEGHYANRCQQWYDHHGHTPEA